MCVCAGKISLKLNDTKAAHDMMVKLTSRNGRIAFGFNHWSIPLVFSQKGKHDETKTFFSDQQMYDFFKFYTSNKRQLFFYLAWK